MCICNPTLSPFKILRTFGANQTKGLAVRCLSYYSSLTPVPWQRCSKSVIDDLSLIIATDFIIIFSCFAKMGLGLEELDTCHFLCPLLIAHLQQTKLLKHMNSRGKKSRKAERQILSSICIVTPDINSAKSTDFLSYACFPGPTTC